jgi:hypothetical protein
LDRYQDASFGRLLQDQPCCPEETVTPRKDPLTLAAHRPPTTFPANPHKHSMIALVPGHLLTFHTTPINSCRRKRNAQLLSQSAPCVVIWPSKPPVGWKDKGSGGKRPQENPRRARTFCEHRAYSGNSEPRCTIKRPSGISTIGSVQGRLLRTPLTRPTTLSRRNGSSAKRLAHPLRPQATNHISREPPQAFHDRISTSPLARPTASSRNDEILSFCRSQPRMIVTWHFVEPTMMERS